MSLLLPGKVSSLVLRSLFAPSASTPVTPAPMASAPVSPQPIHGTERSLSSAFFGASGGGGRAGSDGLLGARTTVGGGAGVPDPSLIWSATVILSPPATS